MKRNGIYITFIIIIIAGVFCGVFGLKQIKQENDFKKNALEVNATIYQNVTMENKQVLYIRYMVNGEQYDGIISSYNKKKYNGSIKILCDKNNPLKYTTGDVQAGSYLLLFLGFVLVVVSFSFVIRMTINESE